jgi:rhodanese-related sulfurtransferase
MSKSHTISTKDLYQQIQTHPDTLLIDVREQDEWDTCHIPFAKHIPKGVLAETISTITNQLDTPIYLHCKSGMRSQMAQEILTQLGYQQVYNVEGGILNWIDNQLPVVTA